MKLAVKWPTDKRRLQVDLFYITAVPFILTTGAVFASVTGHSVFATNAHPSTPTYDYVVQYTDSGFVPDTIDVPVGARVAFINETHIPLATGADPFPSHSDYPDFAANADYGKYGAYIFTFDRGGTYGYHNDERPVDHGTVRVLTGSSTPDISKTKQRQIADRDALLKLFVPGDPSSIFKVIDAIEAKPALAIDCHDVAHDLGHRAYDLYGFTGALAYTDPDNVNHASVMDICAGGYVHGILEQASVEDSRFGDNPGALCANVPAANKPSCYHGVGHALMFFTARDVQASVTACRTMPTASDASRCFEGVYMELFWGNTEHVGPNSLGWDLDHPLDPCTATASDAKPACFIYSVFGYLRANPHNYSGAVHLCTDNNLDSSDSGYCMKGVGITMMNVFHGESLERTEPYAAGLSYAQKLGFYEGVMGYARFSGIAENSLISACGLMMNDKSVCLAGVAGSK